MAGECVTIQPLYRDRGRAGRWGICIAIHGSVS